MYIAISYCSSARLTTDYLQGIWGLTGREFNDFNDFNKSKGKWE